MPQTFQEKQGLTPSYLTTLEKQRLEYKYFHTITIEDYQPLEVYNFLSDFDHLIKCIEGLDEIRMISPQKFCWKMKLKTGAKVEWNLEIVDKIPGTMVSWRSFPESHLSMKGSLWLMKAPGSHSTIVSVSMDWQWPGGKFTELIATLTEEAPDNIIHKNLRRLKAYLETGEIPTTTGQSSGREKNSMTTH